MRIAIVTTFPPGKGSLNEYAFHFVRALRQKPEVSELILLTDELPEGESYPADDSGQEQLAPMRVIPCWRFESARNPLRILQAVRKTQPDAVIFNLQFATFGSGKIAASVGLSAPRLVKMAGYPSIVLLHNIMETVDLQSAGFANNRLMENILRFSGNVVTRMLLGADLVAFTIPKYVEIITEKYGVDNVWLAPHGSFEEDQQLPDMELPSGPKQILAFGKFGTYKKVEALIEATQRLEEQGHGPLEVVIAGTDSPNAQGYLSSVRQQYSHVGNIRFTGYVEEEDVPKIFGEAVVVVFPYTSTTGSSGVLHQAGSYGKAAVLPNIGDFAEIITEEGYAGEFFEPENVDSLASAISRVIDAPERRRELGMRNFLASCGLPISDVVDWYLLHIEALVDQTVQGREPITAKSSTEGSMGSSAADVAQVDHMTQYRPEIV